MSKRQVTIIFPYYENPGQLLKQYEALAALPADLRAAIHLIVCDDGSPKDAAAPPVERLVSEEESAAASILKDESTEQFHARRRLGLASFQLFRVDVDIRWNWITCRNIGVHHAKTAWVLMTDIDHMIPAETARRITGGKLREDNVYRFERVDAPDLTPYKPHPNTWMMTRAMFDKIGGYDERFSGFYGTDGEFRDRVRANAAAVVMLPEVLIRVPREVQADASTTQYERKQPEDREGVTAARRRIATEGGRPHRLTFPYHQVV